MQAVEIISQGLSERVGDASQICGANFVQFTKPNCRPLVMRYSSFQQRQMVHASLLTIEKEVSSTAHLYSLRQDISLAFPQVPRRTPCIPNTSWHMRTVMLRGPHWSRVVFFNFHSIVIKGPPYNSTANSKADGAMPQVPPKPLRAYCILESITLWGPPCLLAAL